MTEDWLQVGDEEIDVAEIMRRIRQRLAQRETTAGGEEEDLQALAESLRREILGETTEWGAAGRQISIRQQECEIVPHHYTIDWRIPILGPIHALVRRVINDEIRRYLLPSLRQQSNLNRKMLRALKSLAEENARLHEELAELRVAE